MGKWKMPRLPWQKPGCTCDGRHEERNRDEVLTELAGQWVAHTHWFMPATGQKLLMLIPSMMAIPGSALYLDSRNAVMHIEGREAMLMAFSTIPGSLSPDKVSGVFTVPRTIPVKQLLEVFPGQFNGKPPEDQKILMLVTRDEYESGGVEFPTLLLDLALFADPEVADELAGHLVDPESDD